MSDNDLAHEILTEAVEKLISEYVDPDRGDAWDGDDAAETIQARFLEWLPDMIRHKAANEVRNGTYPAHVEDGAAYVADEIDPFRLCNDFGGCDRSPHWVRKRDGEDVPYGALYGDEGNEEG
jgi:hypothetical protein